MLDFRFEIKGALSVEWSKATVCHSSKPDLGSCRRTGLFRTCSEPRRLEAGTHVDARLREAAGDEGERLMGRFRKPRYEPEFLERKLNLSATATGVVAAQVSSGTAPEASTTIATVALAPGNPSATVGGIQNPTNVAATAIHHPLQTLTGHLLSSNDSGSGLIADDPLRAILILPRPLRLQSIRGADHPAAPPRQAVVPAPPLGQVVAPAPRAVAAARAARGRPTTPWLMVAEAPRKAEGSTSRVGLWLSPARIRGGGSVVRSPRAGLRRNGRCRTTQVRDTRDCIERLCEDEWPPARPPRKPIAP